LPDGYGSRREFPLGMHDTPESRAEYSRVVAEWLAAGRRLPRTTGATLTVNDLLLAFLDHADGHYSPEGGEAENFRYALRPLRELYGRTPAAKFGPKALKAVRARMVADGLSCGVVNRRIGRIKTAFKWAESEELVPASTHHALATVAGLGPTAPGVRHAAPVRPIDFDAIRPVLPFCSPPVAAMLELQWLAVMRSGEVRIMRTRDIDRSDPARWVYRPGSDAGPAGRHKNAWRGQTRTIYLGPRAIAVLTPWLRPDEPDAYLFSPRRAMAEYRSQQRAARKTKLQPSQAWRKKADPKKVLGECYSRTGYPRRGAPRLPVGRHHLPPIHAPARGQDAGGARRRHRGGPGRDGTQVDQEYRTLR